MSESKIVFSVDRTSVSEGENVMVAWDCGIPDAVTLTIDNGYSVSQIQLADSGSRMVSIHKSKGRTTLRLTAATGGKIERREVVVKVKNLKTTKTYSSPRGSGSWSNGSARKGFSVKGLYDKVRYRIRSFWQRLSYGWSVMPRRTKRIYQFAFVLMIAMWFNTCGQSKGYQMGYEQAMREAKNLTVRYVTEPAASLPTTCEPSAVTPATEAPETSKGGGVGATSVPSEETPSAVAK